MTASHKAAPVAWPGTITLSNIGDVIAWHRLTFKGWVMEEEGQEGERDKPADKGFQPPTSQEELDRIIGSRLAREREKFADYEELKAIKAERDQALEAQKSEHEKAVEQARREGETSALERANGRLVAAEARALAAEAKFAAPALAVRALDLSDVKVGDDGTVDGEAIKAKLTELAESGAFVIGDKRNPPRPDPSQGGGGNPPAAGVSRGREMYQARKGGTKTA